MENREESMDLRILIADGRSLNRSALRFLLREASGFEVVGEAADSDELLAEARTKQPNVVLLEWELPGQPTMDLLPVLRGLNSRLTVIVLNGRPELEPAIRAAGADALIHLGDPPRRLLATLHAIQEDAPSE
jgi:DNA-binding NarL/FixJ family response regulator